MLRRGVAVPFMEQDAEEVRNISELKVCNKGGMIFQLEPGLYEKVHQIDFTLTLPVDHREAQSSRRRLLSIQK